MPTSTTGSTNIAILDSKIIANLCTGIFSVDVTPSTWIGGGASNVLGASVKITNPQGVIIKNYPTSGYDIYPPMTSDVDVAIPTQASNFQYGTYIFTVLLTDAGGTTYEITKSVKICVPDSKNKTRNYGSLSADLDGDCVTGKVTIIVDTPPNYKGFESDSQDNDFTLLYPTVSEVDPLENIEFTNFNVQLYEGEYRFTGTICAHYSLGDNTFAYVNYKVKKYKTIRCLLDRACVAAGLEALQTILNSDCTEKEIQETSDKMFKALYFLTLIDSLTKTGSDGSIYIGELEKVLGCVCTCNCAEGTPIINNAPVGDFVVQGCNVTQGEYGLTTIYTINENYIYETEITENGGAITITSGTVNGCTKTQVATFNIATVYNQIKAQIVNSTEYNAWAQIINSAIIGLDPICLGLTTNQFNALTFKEKMQAILTGLCVGGVCNAQITTGSVVHTGADVTVNWNNISGVYEVAAYLDGLLVGTVLDPLESYTFLGAADDEEHTWTLVSKCQNGSIGNSLNGTFTYYGCPVIASPVSSSSSVVDATCPYDLTDLLDALPMGITAEWHNLNNTLATSLVPDPTAASDGTYFVFAKNTDGCYSASVQIILTCATDTACSAPQNLIVEPITGDFRIRFQSAAYPPPLNSYTVKRRLTASADIVGNYTTIGTPTWNATASRWEIIDTTGIDNTLYTYRAFSNCTSTTPYIDYIFANITCPTLTLTPDQTEMDYSFTGVGGSIDKYEVEIWSSDGLTLIHTNTHVPAFSTPITGTFFYLDDNTTYKVRVVPFIGTYSYDCAFVVSQTILTDNYTLSASYNMSITSVTGTGVPSPALPTTGANGTQVGHHTAMSGSFSISITGSAVPVTALIARVNNVQVDCVDISAGTGTYVLDITAAEVDEVEIIIVNGTCS